jgi:hypothetical protein
MYEKLSNYTYIILLISILTNNDYLLRTFRPLILFCSIVGIIIILCTLDKPNSIVRDNVITDLMALANITNVTLLINLTFFTKFLLIYIVKNRKNTKYSIPITLLVLIIYSQLVDVNRLYNIKKILRL